MKREIGLSESVWVLEPGCVVLVTSGTMERRNVMTFSWQSPVYSDGLCLILLSIARTRYTYELLKEIPELVINVPGVELVDKVHRVGSTTGRKVDKFKEQSLTPTPAEIVRPPLVAECSAHLECTVRQFIPVEKHDLLLCEVVRAVADSNLFSGKWIPEKARTIHHLGGSTYGVLDRIVEASG